MKKFVSHLFGFSFVCIAFVFFIDCVPVSDDYISYKTENTSFHKIAWDLNFINNHPEKINGSAVFLGPSLMQAGVSDSLLNANNYPAVNLAVNGSGNEVSLFFLRRVVKHKPAGIYLHTYKDNHHQLHKMTPLLYNPITLLESGQAVNVPFIRFLFKRTYFVLDYLIWSLCNNKNSGKIYGDYGFVKENSGFDAASYSAITRNQSFDYFESFNLEKNGFVKQQEKNRNGAYFKFILLRRKVMHHLSDWNFIDNGASQRNFVLKEFEVAGLAKVDLQQVYMPVMADARLHKAFDASFYAPQPIHKLVALPHYNFLDSCTYWSDLTHLSGEGAQLFTKKLMQQSFVKPQVNQQINAKKE